ncbi:MAG: HAMP domain-containing protein, partial [Elusimicrobia bacterium]|nr:HAMP domain-containing protein [Elusimicrobiota bacterium]
MNLFARFFLILLLFAMAPLTATGVWVLRFNRDAAETSRRVHEQIAQLAVDLLESAIGDLNRALGFIHDLERGAPEEAVEFKVVQRAMAAHSGFLELAVWRADGSPGPRLGDASLLASADALARDGLVARARADGRAALGEAELLAGHPSLPIAHPLADGRVVYARYSLRQLWARLDRQRIGKRGRVLVLDDLSRPLPGLAQDFPVSRWTGPGRLEEASGWLDAVSAGRDVFVGAFAASPSLRWRVLTLQPRAEAIALNDRFVAEAVTVLVFIGLAVALGAYWLTGRLTRPLRELVRGAERVAQSEFQHAVPPLGWGELDGLGRSFNTMMETLRSYQERQVERLLDEKAKVDALVNTVPDGILLSSLEGEVVYMNAAARGLLSVPEAAKGRGRRLSETLREPILRRMVQDLMKGLQAAVEAELELKDPGGNPRGIFLCRAVTVAAERRTVGILLMLRDVTAQRQMDRMKEEFFHSIVHDLRGPLGTIDGFVQIMGMGALDPPRLKKFTSHIRSSCERLRQLVSDILDTA